MLTRCVGGLRRKEATSDTRENTSHVGCSDCWILDLDVGLTSDVENF